MAKSVAHKTLNSATQRNPLGRDGRRHWFFVGMATILVAIVAVGFAPSFYLRTYFETGQPGANYQTLPVYLIVHGVVLTLWYLLFLGQTVLVASRRTHLHRSLGVVGAVLAVAVFLASMLVVVRSVDRFSSGGVPSARPPFVVIGDIGILILFALFVAGGIRFRRRPDVHKRLMLLASITIVAPAISRLPGAASLVPTSVVLVQLSLFAALVAYDIVSSRRVHLATVWGVILYVVVAVISIAAGFSEIGRGIVNSLKQVV